MRTVVVGLAKILDFWIYTNDKKKKLFDFGKDREEGFGKDKKMMTNCPRNYRFRPERHKLVPAKRHTAGKARRT